MRKAFKYRIYPTRKQAAIMAETLQLCCELYNAGLQERREAYRRAGVSITYAQQQDQLPEIKKTREDLRAVHSQVLQDALRRLDRAMQAFFRRVKNGETPGYPRFKSYARYDSFTYPQSGFEICDGKLVLSKIGPIKIKWHRPLEGTMKTLTLRRTATGKWYACFAVEIEPHRLPATSAAVGVDVGLEAFATLSTGEKIANPRFFREEERELAKAQRKWSAAPAGSPGREKRKVVVARVHERIRHKRENFAHQASRKIINQLGIICVEELRIRPMLGHTGLAKSIQDAAWAFFFHCLVYKAAYAGRQLVKVDPRRTSQRCHRCDHIRTDLCLSDRVYHCTHPECLLIIDRDLNAARNVLALGLQCVGLRPREAACL